MEAVAEAVMETQAILLGNETNVDKLDMWNLEGQYSWNHTFLPPMSHLDASNKTEEAATVCLTDIVMLCVPSSTDVCDWRYSHVV